MDAHNPQIFTWQLHTNSLEVAKYLFTTLMDLPVSFADSALCNMHFNSEYHKLAREEMQTLLTPANDHRHCS